MVCATVFSRLSGCGRGTVIAEAERPSPTDAVFAILIYGSAAIELAITDPKRAGLRIEVTVPPVPRGVVLNEPQTLRRR